MRNYRPDLENIEDVYDRRSDVEQTRKYVVWDDQKNDWLRGSSGMQLVFYDFNLHEATDLASKNHNLIVRNV